jgi:hypothetical protein
MLNLTVCAGKQTSKYHDIIFDNDKKAENSKFKTGENLQTCEYDLKQCQEKIQTECFPYSKETKENFGDIQALKQTQEKSEDEVITENPNPSPETEKAKGSNESFLSRIFSFEADFLWLAVFVLAFVIIDLGIAVICLYCKLKRAED